MSLMHRVRQDRCGYEVLRENRPCAAHFDVEWEEVRLGAFDAPVS